MTLDPLTVQAVEVIALVLGPAGGVYIGIKGALNGLKETNKEQLKLLREMRDDIKTVKERTPPKRIA